MLTRNTLGLTFDDKRSFEVVHLSLPIYGPTGGRSIQTENNPRNNKDVSSRGTISFTNCYAAIPAQFSINRAASQIYTIVKSCQLHNNGINTHT